MSDDHRVPEWFVREFMAHRHFIAAHTINVVARKDGKEYSLEGDWLKRFIPTIHLESLMWRCPKCKIINSHMEQQCIMCGYKRDTTTNPGDPNE